jgi:hypothetical protein
VPSSEWSAVVSYPDRLTAEAFVGLLTAERIPCWIASNADLPGLGFNFSVCVPAALAHRARWILEQVKISESELARLATGQVSDESP